MEFVLPIKAKSDIFDAFKQFKAYAENQSGHRIKILRDDKFFPPPSVEVESTPSTPPAPVSRPSPAVPKPDSNPYYFPPDSDDSDSDDESSSDESLDHGEIWALQHLMQSML